MLTEKDKIASNVLVCIFAYASVMVFKKREVLSAVPVIFCGQTGADFLMTTCSLCAHWDPSDLLIQLPVLTRSNALAHPSLSACLRNIWAEMSRGQLEICSRCQRGCQGADNDVGSKLLKAIHSANSHLAPSWLTNTIRSTVFIRSQLRAKN